MTPMEDDAGFSLLAILHELNHRDLRKKLAAFPERHHYYVILANGIVGSEIAKRVAETPDAVVRDAEGFVSKLLDMAAPEEEELFRQILEGCLVDALGSELAFKCPNCRGFNGCLDLENLKVGGLFKRRVHGRETEELKREIAKEVALALRNTPHLDGDSADKSCERFVHQYTPETIGELFGRYSEVARSIQKDFGINYNGVILRMVPLNMAFCSR